MPPIPTILVYYQRIPAEPKKKIEETYLAGSVIKLELNKPIFFSKMPSLWRVQCSSKTNQDAGLQGTQKRFILALLFTTKQNKI